MFADLGTIHYLREWGAKILRGSTYFWQVIDGGHFFGAKKFEKARETHFSRVSVKNKTKDKDFLRGGGHLFLAASKIKSPPPPCP